MSARPESSLVFRPLCAPDLNILMAIEPTLYSHPWTYGNFADSLAAGHSCWVCEREGTMLGYGVLMLALDEAHLLNISVAGPFQGRGYGRALLYHLIAVARNHGARTMFLEVRPSNHVAIGLYEGAGFNEFSVRKGYYPAHGGREDAVLMGLTL